MAWQQLMEERKYGAAAFATVPAADRSVRTRKMAIFSDPLVATDMVGLETTLGIGWRRTREMGLMA